MVWFGVVSMVVAVPTLIHSEFNTFIQRLSVIVVLVQRAVGKGRVCRVVVVRVVRHSCETIGQYGQGTRGRGEKPYRDRPSWP